MRLASVFLCFGLVGTDAFGASHRHEHRKSVHSRYKSVHVAAKRRHRAPNTSAATWQMPWQIRPINFASRAQRERIVEAVVRKTGRVRGTRTAIATVGRSLRPVPGRNRTVNACRATVSKEAAKFGAREVEAVSAGPEHLNAKRNFVAPVRFRITYKKRNIYEVRLSVLSCAVDKSNKIVDAYALNRV